MTLDVDEIESSFFLYLAGEFPIKDFEQWVYSTPQLEDWLGKPVYFEFISFNFQQSAADHELSKLIRSHVNPARFHAWQVMRFLRSLLDGTGDPVAAFKTLYKMSCNGYEFLDNIGVQYLLGIEEIPELTVQHLWDEKAFWRLRETLDEYIQPLKSEIEILLHALETGEIEIISEQEYFIKPELEQKLQSMHPVLEHKNSKQPDRSKTEVKMGTYNTLETSMTCPHCNMLINAQIDTHFGDTRLMDKFVIGDQYKWIPNKAPQNGGRPEGGNLDGEGYADCSNCRRDFFVKVMIRDDRIESVVPDREKTGYIQEADVASNPPSPESIDQPSTPFVWKPMSRIREIGEITYNEKWELTPQIKDLLEQLARLGADVYSTVGGDDYTILAPPDLSREQQDETDRLMQKLAKQVGGKVNYVDWYPHGWKFRIYPHKGKTS